jgi:hypothetical protein
MRSTRSARAAAQAEGGCSLPRVQARVVRAPGRRRGKALVGTGASSAGPSVVGRLRGHSDDEAQRSHASWSRRPPQQW